jgi:hypothetical protein
MKSRLETLVDDLADATDKSNYYAKKAHDLSPKERELLLGAVANAVAKLAAAKHMLEDDGEDCD